MFNPLSGLPTVRRFILPLLLLAVPAFAQKGPGPVEIVLNPADTTIGWTLGGNVHTTHGTFRLKSGTMRLSPASGEASGLVTIEAISGESGNAARDGRMQKEVLESERFPLITFRPRHVGGGPFSPSTARTYLVDGVLNVHGADHPIQLSVASVPKGNGLGTTIHFEIPYVQWGMRDPSNFVFRTSKTVSIDIDSTARLTP